MIFEKMNKSEAKNEMEKWKLYGDVQMPSLDEKYGELRKTLTEYYLSIPSEKEYTKDLQFGLYLYEILKIENGMSLREASDEEIWIDLQVRVIPNIVAMRWGYDNDVRFYKTKNRLWLRTIWWYIHLSWQGDVELTAKILRRNTTDEILQLVDRTSKKGFDVNLYREIMRAYDRNRDDNNQKGLFRKVMTLNTLYIQTIEPSLYEGGIEGYVNMLFDKAS
ncbi:hypothetical protein EPJ90_04405 [Erysipelothrix sp. strain 2 (EsS2-7-Brazil)]|uniref:hypothetical protein n=1 Tax=Erysipelothrix sp. strain 2 (EsS2-7-Brazil) TaxID=2500579 RepID=UPI001A922A0C|nr:hypothetical protein [Erysipelothrix sp. strain 2 (EsS2-7-Brazil)]MBK2404081.1 hypothetical protein [Erysipelothrix sp. strain 2 (EsS2-7-Brazil)]